MPGELGEKIGEGAFSDVHAWAPGQVVKLFKPEVRRRTARYEAHITRAVFEAGGPAQPVLEEVTIDGRLGMVLPRLEGPTLVRLLQAGGIALEEAAEVLARLALSVHQAPTPADALPVRDYMEASLRLSDGSLPDHVATGVLAMIDRLPPDDRLSHCDLHPGNVIMTSDGPRLLDWTGAKRGGAPLDLACCRFLRTELVVESLGPPERQRAFDAAMLSAYARLSGADAAVLESAVQAHLPIVRLFFLLGGGARPATRVRLLQRLEADVAEGR